MNIFILSQDPKQAAQYHCDQHIHKMILESAQMLSTAAYDWFPNLRQHLYKPTHLYHPCTQWLKESICHMSWLVILAEELNEIRKAQGCASHRSMHIINAISDNIIPTDHFHPKHFAEAMPSFISLRTSINTVEKYHIYYRYKHAQWLDSGRGMTYKDRPIPPFMSDVIIQASQPKILSFNQLANQNGNQSSSSTC